MLKDRLVAHRGYQQLYPENTLLAIHKAIEAGARYLEIDVMFSADGVPVIYHDITMQRVSGIENAIHLLPAAELAQMPAYEPERLGDTYRSESIALLSALQPVLQSHPDVHLFVELKRAGIQFLGSESVLTALADTLQGIQKQCSLISYDREFILAARQQGWPSVGVILESWEDLQLPVMRAIHPDYVFASQRHVPENALLEFGSAMLVVYEIGNADLAIQWFRRGVDMIETFDVGGMLRDLAHRAL